MKLIIAAGTAIFVLISLSAFAIGQQCTNGNVRLVGSSTISGGTVEVCKDRTWGTVCDSGWGINDARVVCKQLGYGYTTGVSARINAYYGQGSGPIHMSYVGCTGVESILLNCSYSRPNFYCRHRDDAGVTCGWRTVQYNISNNATAIKAIRLISNGGNNLGRIELLYNRTWGTICADSYWSILDAAIACRMIGYSDAACAVRTNRWYGSITSPSTVWMHNVQCTGSEETLDRCPFSGWTSNYCHSYYYKAGIVCTNISQIDKSYNIQLINSTTKTLMIHWTGPATETQFDTRSIRSIRYRIIYSWNSGASSLQSIIVYAQSEDGELSYTIGSLSRGTNYTVQVRTEVNYYYCSSYAYVNSIYSDPVSFQTNATAKSSRIPIRLVSPYSGVDFLGRVEVFHDSQWGTICDDSFSTTDGDIVCWMLNFTQGALCTFGSARYGQGTGPIWLDNVGCNYAYHEVLEDCYSLGWGIHDCHHSEDVSVICRSSLPPVKNLTVTIVSAVSVTVRWNQYVYSSLPADDAQFYVLYSSLESNQSAVVSSVSQTEYTLKNLQIQKQYNISIHAQVQFCCYYRSQCTTLYGEFSNEVRVMTEKPVYFQLRMTPVLNCLSFTDPSANNITDRLLQVRRAIIKSFNTDGCPDCGLTDDDILADEFSCRGGLTKHIIYRAAMVGYTQQHSARALVSLLHSWVVSGSASITVFFHRLHLDKDCKTYLGNLSEPDCPLQHGSDSQADQKGDSTSGEISSYLIVAIVFGVMLILGIVLVIMVVVMKYFKSKTRRERFISQGIQSCHHPYDITPKLNEKHWFDDKTTVAVHNNQAYGSSLQRPCAEMPPFPIYDIIPLQPVSSQVHPGNKPDDDSET